MSTDPERGARVRLKSVKFKRGGSIELVKFERDPFLDELVKRIIAAAQRHAAPVAGCAIVLWDVEGGTTGFTAVKPGSAIPGILIPDLVRNVLLGNKIEQWTIETIMGRDGG